MILNKNVIKELILNDEQQRKKKAKNKNREDDDLNLNKNKKKKQDVKLKRKRGRPKGVKNKKEEDKLIDEPANEKIGDDKDLELIESIFDTKGENNINSIMKENLDLKEKYNEVGKQNYDEVNEK